MPGFLNYVPSTRALRIAWTAAAAMVVAVMMVLVVMTITTSAELHDTTERLDQTEAERAALQAEIRERGLRLTFEDDAPPGVGVATFRCRPEQPAAYVCRPEPQ